VKKSVFLLWCVAICLNSCNFDFDEDFILSPFSQYWKAPPAYDDNEATRFLNVAAVSFHMDFSPEVNREKIVYFIDKIKAERPDVQLILFPETALGFYFNPLDSFEYQKSVAETIPGETTSIISQKAKEYQIYISFGMVETANEKLYNSQVLIGTDGSVSSVHHKNFLISQDKSNGFNAGSDITLNIIENIKVATIICADINSIEANRKIHELGAELVLLPLADADSAVSDLLPHQYTYTWILSANRIGNEYGINYNGMLCLSAPSGEHRVKTSGKEGYIYGVVKCR